MKKYRSTIFLLAGIFSGQIIKHFYGFKASFVFLACIFLISIIMMCIGLFLFYRENKKPKDFIYIPGTWFRKAQVIEVQKRKMNIFCYLIMPIAIPICAVCGFFWFFTDQLKKIIRCLRIK